jgi:hypothetical protein
LYHGILTAENVDCVTELGLINDDGLVAIMIFLSSAGYEWIFTMIHLFPSSNSVRAGLRDTAVFGLTSVIDRFVSGTVLDVRRSGFLWVI